MRSDVPPWNTRFIALLIFVGWGSFLYFFGAEAGSFVLWSFAIASVFVLWLFFRGPHFFFSLDKESIAWSDNLKRTPTTRIPLADIREARLVIEMIDTEKLILVDVRGVSYPVCTAGFAPWEVFEKLRRFHPDATYSRN